MSLNSPYNIGPTTKLIDAATLVTDAPRPAQASTVVVTSATNLKTYTITINGTDIDFVADGTALVSEIADGREAAVNAEALVNTIVTAVSDNVDTVVITADVGGTRFTITEIDAELDLFTVYDDVGHHARNHQYLHLYVALTGGTSVDLKMWVQLPGVDVWAAYNDFGTAGTRQFLTAAPNPEYVVIPVFGVERVAFEIEAINGASVDVYLGANSEQNE